MAHTACMNTQAYAAVTHAELVHSVRLPLFNSSSGTSSTCVRRYTAGLKAVPVGPPCVGPWLQGRRRSWAESTPRRWSTSVGHVTRQRDSNSFSFWPRAATADSDGRPSNSPRRQQDLGQLLGRRRCVRERQERHHSDRAELRFHGGKPHAPQVSAAAAATAVMTGNNG